jgi:hypothetical protein
VSPTLNRFSLFVFANGSIAFSMLCDNSSICFSPESAESGVRFRMPLCGLLLYATYHTTPPNSFQWSLWKWSPWVFFNGCAYAFLVNVSIHDICRCIFFWYIRVRHCITTFLTTTQVILSSAFPSPALSSTTYTTQITPLLDNGVITCAVLTSSCTLTQLTNTKPSMIMK